MPSSGNQRQRQSIEELFIATEEPFVLAEDPQKTPKVRFQFQARQGKHRAAGIPIGN